MVQRYRSVLSALQYSIVHLFGDYPETDYTVEAACQLNARNSLPSDSCLKVLAA